jgi:hypothetical protein
MRTFFKNLSFTKQSFDGEICNKLNAVNIQTQHKFKYAQQQILFFKLLFNVKLIYSIQVLGSWLWGNRPFFFFSGGAEEGA